MPGRLFGRAMGGARTSRSLAAAGGDAGIAARTAMHHNVGRASAHSTATAARASRRAGMAMVPYSGANTLPRGRQPARFEKLLGRAGSRRRSASMFGVKTAGGVMGAGLGMNAVLGPRPPSSGRSGLQPGGTGLPY